MSFLAASATTLLFGLAGFGAIGTIVGTLAGDWHRIVQVLRDGRTPADHGSSGVLGTHRIHARTFP